MIIEPRENFDTEEIHFDAQISGRTIRIIIARNTIDDKAERTTTKEERLEFVRTCKERIVDNVRDDIGNIEVNAFPVGESQLRNCSL